MRAIFIGGCHRSGTTLLGAMLGGHKECLTVPESQFKTEALRSWGTPKEPEDVRAAFHRIMKHPRFKLWGMSWGPNLLPESEKAGSYRSLLEWVVSRYGEQVGKRGFRMWVDHTPKNMMNLYTLLNVFPDAKVIHLVRDGRAVSASVMRQDWGPNTIISAAYWWLHRIVHGLAAESAFGQDRIVRIRYEDLVARPEEVLKGLCSWLGIGYDPAMAKGGGFKPWLYSGDRAHALVGKEPDPSRVAAWEKDLSPRQIETFENLTGEMLSYLGYDLMYGLKAREVSRSDKVRATAVELYKVPLNVIRYTYRRRGLAAERRLALEELVASKESPGG